MPYNIPSLSALRNYNYRDLLMDPFPFLFGWVFLAMTALWIPYHQWNYQRQRYYQYIGYSVEYEQAQRAYENANQDNNNQNNYVDFGCSWWNWSCKQKQYRYQQYQNNNNQDENQMQLPGWYTFLGGTSEEDRREGEEEGMGDTTPGGVKLVFWWTLAIFAALVVYGAYSIFKNNSLQPARMYFFLLAQFAVLGMIVLVQGVIQTDGRAMEDSVYGWFGQLPVLMVFTDFWICLYSIVAVVALTGRMMWARRQANATETTSAKVDGEGYREMEGESA